MITSSPPPLVFRYYFDEAGRDVVGILQEVVFSTSVYYWRFENTFSVTFSAFTRTLGHISQSSLEWLITHPWGSSHWFLRVLSCRIFEKGPKIINKASKIKKIGQFLCGGIITRG
jgi:hypothetical protein